MSKGRRRPERIWDLPFGRVVYPLRRVKDRATGRSFSPLAEALELPERERWLE